MLLPNMQLHDDHQQLNGKAILERKEKIMAHQLGLADPCEERPILIRLASDVASVGFKAQKQTQLRNERSRWCPAFPAKTDEAGYLPTHVIVSLCIFIVSIASELYETIKVTCE